MKIKDEMKKSEDVLKETKKSTSKPVFVVKPKEKKSTIENDKEIERMSYSDDYYDKETCTNISNIINEMKEKKSNELILADSGIEIENMKYISEHMFELKSLITLDIRSIFFTYK